MQNIAPCCNVRFVPMYKGTLTGVAIMLVPSLHALVGIIRSDPRLSAELDKEVARNAVRIFRKLAREAQVLGSAQVGQTCDELSERFRDAAGMANEPYNLDDEGQWAHEATQAVRAISKAGKR